MMPELSKGTLPEREQELISSGETYGGVRLSALLQDYWKEYQDLGSESLQTYDNKLKSVPNAGSAGTITNVTTADGTIVELPQSVRRRADQSVSFHPLQEWEGYIVGVGNNTFKARLTDLTAGETIANEEVELPIDDLTDDDRDLLAPGYVFRWAIGYQRTRSGAKKRISQIVFRRLPQWTEKELAKAEEEGKNLSSGLKWD